MQDQLRQNVPFRERTQLRRIGQSLIFASERRGCGTGAHGTHVAAETATEPAQELDLRAARACPVAMKGGVGTALESPIRSRGPAVAEKDYVAHDASSA